MDKKLIARSEVSINASSEKVWEALTKPELVKQYLFGTDMKTTWEVGSPITYTGEWEGKPYEDKGTILEVVPGKKIVMTYWSPASGVADIPENYKTIAYEIIPQGDTTKLVIIQDNNGTEESRDQSEQNWSTVLGGIKKLLEV
ncbi:MAG: SRPBCC domain-containing protein [bacterium]|nr:SRPBCC domain-containing protein [bacterium]